MNEAYFAMRMLADEENRKKLLIIILIPILFFIVAMQAVSTSICSQALEQQLLHYQIRWKNGDQWLLSIVQNIRFQDM